MKSSLFRLTLIVSLLAVSAAGQTQIDLRTQAKDVDFSGASSTKPIQTDTSLPAVCSLGQTFLLTSASLGQNLYMCTAANVWTRQGGAAMLAQLADFTVTYTTAQTLAIGANCSTATPCNVRIGTTVYSFSQGCTATVAGGTGTAYIYFDSTGALTIGHNLTLSASAGCVAASGVTNFPPGSIPLHTWSAVDGAWDTAGGLDYRAMLATKGIAATTGLLTVDSATSTTISLDTAVVPTYLNTNAVLAFPLIPNGTCADDLSFTLAGAAVNDAVAPGWPAALEPRLLANMRVSAPGTIAVRLCNFSGSDLTPASATYGATIVRSF
jgi:hypothetical protein